MAARKRGPKRHQFNRANTIHGQFPPTSLRFAAAKLREEAAAPQPFSSSSRPGDLPDGRSPQNPVQPSREKYSASVFRKNMIYSRHPVLATRGASRVVTNVGTGCGGRKSVGRDGSQGGFRRERFERASTTGADADGEVVWFWRPRVGVKVSMASRGARPGCEALLQRTDGVKTANGPREERV